MLNSMTNWFRKRSSRADGVDRGYTSFNDTDLERGLTTPEDAMLERIQRGEHNGSETFDELHGKLVWVVMGTLIVAVVVVLIIIM